MIRGFADVLALWTPKQLSRVLKVPYHTAAAMYQRESIASRYWARLIKAAEARGETITADMLVRFADERKPRPRRRRSPARAEEPSVLLSPAS
jgi:hypothetical protein